MNNRQCWYLMSSRQKLLGTYVGIMLKFVGIMLKCVGILLKFNVRGAPPALVLPPLGLQRSSPVLPPCF